MQLLYITNARIPSRRAHSVQMMKMCEAFSQVTLKDGTHPEVTFVAARRREKIDGDPYDFYGVSRTFTIKKLWCLDLPELGKAGHVLQLVTFALSGLVYALTHKADLIYTRDEIFAPMISIFKKNAVYELHTRRDLPMNVFTLRHISRIVSITAGLREYYTKAYGIPAEKFFIAPDGVTLEKFIFTESKEEIRKKLGLPVERKIIGHLGKITTLGKPKGVEDLVRAFPEVQKKHPDAFLLLAGLEQAEIPVMQGIVQNAGLTESDYTIIGHVPQKDFPPYFVSCDALVMNYPNTEHYRLFMSPIKLFEYMAAQAAIVSTDLPSVREILDETTAVFVQPDDPGDLARGLIEVFDHPDVSQTRVKHAYEKVSTQYTWQKRAQEILNTI